MKNNLRILLALCAGFLLGGSGILSHTGIPSNLSLCILYVLMFQVGLNLGSNREFKHILSSLRPRLLLVPLATIGGTLLFSALASLVLSRWNVFECMAVGSGFAYYSLSSILITQFKEAELGVQMAAELGTIALMANILREMMALLGAPLFSRYFRDLAPISAAGVNSMDVVLPQIRKYAGDNVIPIAILHGVLVDMSVPLFVSFFCSL